MIEINGLSFKYVGRRQPTLRELSLRIPDGQSVLVLGPSGCGKSTLALCLNGAVPHAIEGDLRGTVRVDGLDTRRASLADLAQRVGIVFQDPETQFCMLSVEDEVAFGLENLAIPRAEMDGRIDDALARVGLGERRRDRIERLSGGQKQRLALACVLAQEPDILVLDEPTAQLDPAGAAELLALLGGIRARRQHTLIVVEHRLDEIMGLIDRVVVLSAEGELVADGPPRRVIRDHGDWLAEAGVWTPQVSELAGRLARSGIELDPFPLTVPEAVEALRPHLAQLDLPTLPWPMLGANIGCDVVRRTMFAGPRPDIPVNPPTTGPLYPHGPTAPQPPLRRGEGEQDAPAAALAPATPVEGQVRLLDVHGLSYQYPRGERPVLRDVSFGVGAGELVAVVGANGTGKSTLARLIAGILQSLPGTIAIDGKDVADTPPARLARDVGYVFQYPEHQFVGQTVLDDVAYGPRRAGLPEPEAVALASAMLDDFGLLRLAPAHPFSLSHGEQRRLSVASMLVLGQRLLLLDEPTFGQDHRNATMLMDKLKALADDGRAIVVVSHDMRLVAERARRVLVLVDGALAFDGPPGRLFADDALLARAHLVAPPLWQVSRALGLGAPIGLDDPGGARSSNIVPLAAAPAGREAAP